MTKTIITSIGTVDAKFVWVRIPDPRLAKTRKKRIKIQRRLMKKFGEQYKEHVLCLFSLGVERVFFMPPSLHRIFVEEPK